MADPYIDQFETQIYGKFAREQMAEVCIGKVPELDSMVKYAIASQDQADRDMKSVLDRQPRPGAPLSQSDVLDQSRDTIVRFGSFLDSLKGRPVDPRSFFRSEAPSIVARRRLTKLTGAVSHLVAETKKHKDKIRDSKMWLTELEEVHGKLEALEKQQRASKVEKADLAPEVAAARDRWLTVYNANKLLIRGLLAHAGKPDLLPHIFDDLAEVQRTTGTSDAPPPDPSTPPPPASDPAKA